MGYLIISDEASRQGLIVEEGQLVSVVGKAAAIGSLIPIAGQVGIGAIAGVIVGAVGKFLGIFGKDKKIDQWIIERDLLSTIFANMLPGQTTVQNGIPKLLGSYERTGVEGVVKEMLHNLRNEFSHGSDDYDDVTQAINSLAYTTVAPTRQERILLIFDVATGVFDNGQPNVNTTPNTNIGVPSNGSSIGSTINLPELGGPVIAGGVIIGLLLLFR